MTVVAPRIRDDVRALPVTLLAATVRAPTTWTGRYLVVAATEIEALNASVADAAAARSLLCNVVDDPDKCTVILPAIHRQGPISVAVSTGGASPALAKWLRDRIAAEIGPAHADLARQLRALRPWARRASRPTTTARPTSSGSSSGRSRDRPPRRRRPWRSRPDHRPRARARPLLRRARLRRARLARSSSPRRPPTRSLISRAPLRQAEIDALLVEYGRAGLDVVRLKGGDPFVFGRGGEEALALAAAGDSVHGHAGRLEHRRRPGGRADPGHAPRCLGSGHDRERPRPARRPRGTRRARARRRHDRPLHGPRAARRSSRPGSSPRGSTRPRPPRSSRTGRCRSRRR